MKKLNLGSSTDIKPGYVNLDSVKTFGIDVVHDLDIFPYPFPDNEFDEIFCSHILEHVTDFIQTMKELRRIAKPKAKIIVRAPHFSCGVSYRDPTHRRLFSYFTFDYFTADCPYAPAQFKILTRKLNFTRLAFPFLNILFNPLINLSPTLYERFFCWMLPTAECLFELEVIK